MFEYNEVTEYNRYALLEGSKKVPLGISMSWLPAKGFLKQDWVEGWMKDDWGQKLKVSLETVKFSNSYISPLLTALIVFDPGMRVAKLTM